MRIGQRFLVKEQGELIEMTVTDILRDDKVELTDGVKTLTRLAWELHKPISQS